MSLNIKVVRNYAETLNASAVNCKNKRDVYDQLISFANSLDSSPKIKEFIDSPINSFENKKNLINKFGEKCKDQSLIVNFLYALVKNDRIGFLQEIAEEYKNILDAEDNIQKAEVFSARDLSETDKKEIILFLEEKLGMRVQIKHVIDKELIGGVIIKYQNTIIDCSVSGSLDRLQKNIVKSSILESLE